MSKKTIFYYEFRRLVCSRTYLLLLAAVVAYCVFLLRSSVIFGTLYTAPFSKWTFCDYLSSVSVLLLVLLLALCARQFIPSERGAMTIISAAPTPVSTFKAIRYGAIACAFLIAAALSVGVCFAFYWLVFDYTAFGGLIWLSMPMLLPSALLVFGVSMLLGNKKAALVYVLLGVVLIVGAFRISLPAYIDIIGSSVTLPLYAGEREFAFTAAFAAGRIVFITVGITCIIISLWLPQKRLLHQESTYC